MEIPFRLIKIKNPMIPGKTAFMEIQVTSLAKNGDYDNLITAQCASQGELDYEINYMIKELENIRNRAREQWG